ncbi:MAG: hypothetical protein U5Q44_09355 [Dehalococcoidia bacterium]|nr:hypothetical protein [Dehalococcoidia bacterium]
MRAYRGVKESSAGRVEAEDRQELERFYNSMRQWRNRHRETPIQVKKDGDNEKTHE